MDKKKRRKKKSQSNPSAPSQPIILGALRSDQVFMCVCLCVCGSKPPGDTGMDLLTWTRKGKDSNIYYIYTYIYIDWYVTQKSKSGEFVGTFCYCYCYYYYYCCYCLCVCVCVYPCKQFVVVTIRRTGSWNTIPTLPYLTLLTFFSSDSDKIYRDSSSIHRLVSRKNDYSGRRKKSPSEQISNLPENSLESITIQSNPIQQVQSPRS